MNVVQYKSEEFDKIMYRKITNFLKKLTVSEIYDALGDCYTILAPQYYIKKSNFNNKGNFPRAYIKPFVRTFKSDTSHPKTTITKNGKIIKKVDGVSNEDIVDDLCRWYKIDTSETGQWFGRNKCHMYCLEKLVNHIHINPLDLIKVKVEGKDPQTLKDFIK